MPDCLRCRQKGIACIYEAAQISYAENASPSSEVRSSTAGIAAASPSIHDTPLNEVLPTIKTPTGPSSSRDEGSSHTIREIDVRAGASAAATVPHLPSSVVHSYSDNDSSHTSALVQTFFRNIHPNPECSFLHKAVFMNHRQSKQLDLRLLRAVCSMASLLHPNLRPDGARWADEAEGDVLSSLTRPSIVCVQVLQLLVIYRLATGDSRRVVSLFALCTRIAFLLRLNYEDPSLPSLAQESRRRLMWAIYITDTFMSGGIEDLTLCRATAIHLWLPSDEQAFELDHPSTKHVLREDSSDVRTAPSVFGFLLRVVDIRDRILRYTKSAPDTGLSAVQMQHEIQRIESELQHQQQNWPESIVLNAKNISLRGCSASLQAFVLLHVFWHQCHCDLYRFFTPGFRESIPSTLLRCVPQAFVQDCIAKCVSHACSVAEIFGHILDLEPESPLTAPNLALCAYQCANIISKSVYMKGISRPLDTTVLVSRCLHMVERLHSCNPALAPIRRDIQKLLDEGAPPVSQSRQASPQPGVQPGGEAGQRLHSPVRHKFSRYNVLDAANVSDSGEALYFRDSVQTVSASANETPRAPSLEVRSGFRTEPAQQQLSFLGGDIAQMSPGSISNDLQWSNLNESWMMSVLNGTGLDYLNDSLDSFMESGGWAS